MDLSLVRLKFQKIWNNFLRTNYSGDLSQVHYSLQQESLNSEDMFLHITSPTNPQLEGSLIEISAQRWIVQKAMREHVNKDMWIYKLLPTHCKITLALSVTTKNAIGSTSADDTIDGNDKLVDGAVLHVISGVYDAFLDFYDRKERLSPTAQPVDSFEQNFFIAVNQLENPKLPYVMYYGMDRYKVGSIERVAGSFKITAIKDV